MKIPDPFQHPVLFPLAIVLTPVPTEVYIHFDSPLTIHIVQEPK